MADPRYDLRRQTMLDTANALTSLRRLKRMLEDRPRFAVGTEGNNAETMAAETITDSIFEMTKMRGALETLDTF